MSTHSVSPSTASENKSHEFRSSLELLYELGREVTSDLDLRTLLHRVIFLSMKNVGATSGSIIVLDETGQPSESALLILGQTHTYTAMQLRVTYENGMAGWVARNRQAVLIPDTSSDKRWLQRPEDLTGKSPSKSAVSAPILARDQLVGVITLVHPTPGFFTQDHLDLVNAIAGWAGTAILHAQLIDRLQAANLRYRELFEDSIDPILITDWTGKILEINRQAEKITDLAGQTLRDSCLTDINIVDPEKVGPDFERLRGGDMVTYETSLRTAIGVDVPVRVYARLIHAEAESKVQWILQDLTERKELDRLREDLAAMIYHDLRSPLSNIISSLEMVSGMLAQSQDETVQSVLNIARRSAERIQRLTSSLLDIHRLESGQVIGVRNPILLQDLICDAVAAVQQLVDARSQKVTVSVESDLPPIPADADMVRRVLINLLDNAVKFSPDGSAIDVTICQQDDSVLTAITDAGPGIPPSYQDRIFEKFARIGVSNGPGGDLRGLGLGLAFCRLAVAAHGGRIWVENEPGRGSVFKFILPIDKTDISRGT